MSEEIANNPILGEKSQSPSKIINNNDEKDLKNKNMTEESSNKSKGYLLKGKLTKEFIDEDELDGISITYKENEKKIKTITLDLLLKKIVTENFIEKNPIQIFSFCQQCFCFMDKEIMFNKIFNCYNFYKEKKVPIEQIGNLIKFLNILVIEMYEYYTKVNLDDPILILLRNFYNTLISEICKLIDYEAEQKVKLEENLNINDFQNKLEELNEDGNENNNKQDDRCSTFVNQDINQMSRERYGTIAGCKDDGRFSSYLDENNKNNYRNTISIPYKKMENEEKDSKKDLSNLFLYKKEKPVKLEDKKEKEEKKNELQEKINQTQNEKMSSTPEEEIIICIRNIIILFSIEEPGKNYLRQAKNYIDFYKDIYKKIAEAIGKPILLDSKNKRTMAKSMTIAKISKKNKLKLHENDGFFDVQVWDKEEIGEKLISISKNLISKVKRREIYKAVYLKKTKETTSPNVLENIDKFNRLIFFIIEDILSYDYAKDRAKIIERWIKIANYCRNRKDYNDCVAINSALNNYILTGMEKTKNEISKDKEDLLKQLNRFCRIQGNYKKLREDMKTLGYYDFYVPYLGMLLKDLAFYEENSKYLIDDVLINFEKLENVQIAVSDFFNFKNTTDKDFIQPPEELDFFDKLENLNENKLEELANNLEPEFKLRPEKKRQKRPTNIDIKYFADISIHRPNMRNSKRLTKNK